MRIIVRSDQQIIRRIRIFAKVPLAEVKAFACELACCPGRFPIAPKLSLHFPVRRCRFSLPLRWNFLRAKN